MKKINIILLIFFLLNHYCSYSVKPKTTISQRLKTTNNDYQCEKCQSCFSNKGNLNKHLKNIHKEKLDHYYQNVTIPIKQTKNYRCSICESRFDNRGNLNKHFKTHEEKIYSCEHCTYNSTRKDNLERHINFKHSTLKKISYENTYSLPHICTFCNIHFGLQCNLNKHMKKLHSQEMLAFQFQMTQFALLPQLPYTPPQLELLFDLSEKF